MIASPERSARIALAALAALVVAACATPDATKPAEQRPSSTPSSTAPGSTGTPATAATPEVPAAEARPMAARLALQAVDQLQVGDEAGARATLDQALKLDPANDLAKNLLAQINADAQRELGATFWRYTVQPGESLSRLAQQYMGDRFRFWILAKYNDITNPSRVSVGQVVKIPGRQPATPPPVVATPEPPPVKAPEPEAPKVDAVADAMKRGADMEKSGNLEAAYATYNEVVARYPTNTDAVKKRDTTKASLIRTLDRDASQAFQRQNLDLAITKWDRILELDPNNRKARLERERALDLKKRMAEKFGGAK
jgi:tetratricopeptide (TPR) repeat protein